MIYYNYRKEIHTSTGGIKMKNIITAGKYKGMEYDGTFGFENCTVEQERDEHSGKDVIIIKYEDGKLSGALTKKIPWKKHLRIGSTSC